MIARNAWPARFQRDGTLVVHAADAIWAFELTQQAAEISSRLPGTPPLTFVQGPIPERGAEPAEAAPPALPPTSVEDEERVAEWTSSIADAELREAVANAARASLSRAQNDRSV